MKDSFKLIFFVLVMGAISALVLIGTDALTKNRIEANKLFEFQSTVLRANNEDVSGDLNNRFNEIMEMEEKDGLIIYTHKETGNISFTFEGKGMWDVIKGIMTLEDDWKTIVDVTITDHGETPGLGALAAERNFLDTLTKKVFSPTILITGNADKDSDNEVDSISGATGTSSKVQVILNDAYKLYYETFVGELVLVDEDELFAAILDAHNISYDEDSNLSELIKNNFKVFNEDDLKVYVNTKTARITFADTYELAFGQNGDAFEEVMLILTLESDFETIYKLQSLDDGNTDHWGKLYLLEQSVLDRAIGKKFPNLEFINTAGTNDNQIDNVGSATHTRKTFNLAINNLYDRHYQAFKDVDFNVEEDLTLFIEILKAFAVDYEDLDVKEVFNEKFETLNESGKELFVHKDTNSYVITFDKEYTFAVGLDHKEELTTILVLEEDFKTVKKLVVLHDGDTNHWGKVRFFTEERLNSATGKFFPNLTFKVDATGDHEVDGVADATTTQAEFNQFLNEVYNSYAEVYLALSEEQLLLMNILTNNNILVDEDSVRADENYLTDLISNHFNVTTLNSFVVYENKNNGDLTYYFESTYSLGRGLTDTEDLVTVVTLRSNLKTIVKMNVLHDGNSSQWGKTRLFVSDVLNRASGKNILELEFVSKDEPNKGPNDVDLTTDATTTRVEFNHAVKDYYNQFVIEFNNVTEEDLAKAHMLLNAKVLPTENLNDLFNNTYETLTKDSYEMFVNKETKEKVIVFIEEYSLGNNLPDKEELTTILVLEDDFKTVKKLVVLHDNKGAHWGKTRFFIPKILNKAIGKQLPDLNFVTPDEDGDLGDNEVDATTRATVTRNEFNQALKDVYNTYYGVFKEEN